MYIKVKYTDIMLFCLCFVYFCRSGGDTQKYILVYLNIFIPYFSFRYKSSIYTELIISKFV